MIDTDGLGGEMAIRTSGLTKRFGKQTAVDRLDLCVPSGTAFGFIGMNGAGKSTTIRMLMGILRRDAGEINVLGCDVRDRAERVKHRIGYVPEQHFIYRWMRVRDAIRFCRAAYVNWDDRRCDELLKLFDLDESKRVRHLSKGQVVKLALLIAVTHDPELLILDEPTSGLDPLVREEFLDGVLRTICERQRTLLFSSHTLGDVQRIADRVGIIHKGQLLACCPTDELLGATKRLRVVLDNGVTPERIPDGTIWQQVNRREWLLTVQGFTPETIDFLRSHYSVKHVDVMDLGLEDVFKDLVRGRRASA